MVGTGVGERGDGSSIGSTEVGFGWDLHERVCCDFTCERHLWFCRRSTCRSIHCPADKPPEVIDVSQAVAILSLVSLDQVEQPLTVGLGVASSRG